MFAVCKERSRGRINGKCLNPLDLSFKILSNQRPTLRLFDLGSVEPVNEKRVDQGI